MSKKKLLIITISSLLLLSAVLLAAREYISSSSLNWEEQWMVSPHNFDPVESAHGAGANRGCVKCHNSEWFVRIQAKGEEPPAENLAEPAQYGHTCRTCHETENPTNILALRKVGDVTLPSYGDVVSAGVSASCMSCHNARRENPPEYIKTAFRGTHGGPQSDMLSGTGAITYGETFGSSAHTIVTTKGCVTCHQEVKPAMGERGYHQVGGHTLRMYWDGGTPNNHNDDVENVAACQKCHPTLDTFDMTARGDYDGNGAVEGVQTEVKGLLALLAAELPQDDSGNVSIPRDLTLTTLEQRMANYNYTLVTNDGSYGIHNPAYAVQVLRTTYEKFTGKALPGDTIKAAPLVANRPVTSEAIEKRLKQWEVSPHNFDPVEFGSPATNRSCVQCHDSEWFVRIQIKGEAPPAENLAAPAKYGHTCSTCHAIDDATNILRLNLVGDVKLPSYGDVVHAGIAASCMSCHNARRVNPPEYIKTSFRGTHGGPQADMLSGTGAINYGKTLESSSHIVAVEKKCVGCHMAATPASGKPGYNLVGTHTFNVRWDNGTDDDPSDDVENVSACQTCHLGVTTFDFPAREDYDGDGTIEGVQTEVKGMLAILASALPQDANGNVSIPNDLSLTTEQQRMANYNYALVVNDGSYGVHNFKYAVNLLRTTYKALTGEEMVPKVKDYSNVFFATLEPGLNMISLPLEPKTQYTARKMAEELGTTIVIKMDAKKKSFVGFTADDPGDGFAIEGAKGYIVNVKEGKAVAFTGAAWTNQPPISAAPTNVMSSAWAYVASGILIDENQFGKAHEGYTIIAKNLRTGVVAMDAVSSENGRFAAVWADLNRKSVVEVGDVLEIVAVDSTGNRVAGPIHREITTPDIGKAFVSVTLKPGDIIPDSSALLQNFPNPFNPETWIPFQLSESADVKINIYDASGKLIKTIDLGHRQAGIYLDRSTAVFWNGRTETGEQAASGIYFYQIKADKFTQTRKMILVK